MAPERVLTCSLTAAGSALARRLPFEQRSGGLVATVAERWRSVDGFVLVCATGIAVRAIAPLLAGKQNDPAVVCVDDAGRYAIALCGGHSGGANNLARQVAALLGAEAVLTTATDAAGLPALDTLPGFSAAGDVAGVTRAWLDGTPPALEVDPALAQFRAEVLAISGDNPMKSREPRVLVSDRVVDAGPGQVVLRPRSLVLGVGAVNGADPGALAALVRDTLDGAGLDATAVGVIATVDRKATEAAILALAEALKAPLRTFTAAALAAVDVPNPSTVVQSAVGTPSVSEAAALLGAGSGGALVVEKRRNAEATVAVARRAAPEGHLLVVGLGPGDARHRTPEASAAVAGADVVMGYGLYVDLAADLLAPRHEVVRFPIGAEVERCRAGLERAAAGARVALVCSGDPGVYAMASLVCELAPGCGDPPVTIVPGVTAALAAAAILGAPLGHDHAALSLSDLLTPWPVIRKRLEAVAASDLVVSLYNPRSIGRTHQLDDAIAAFSAHRLAGTPVAVVTNAGRPGEQVVRTTLADLDTTSVGMMSLVVVGASSTRWVGHRMVTPRGYEP